MIAIVCLGLFFAGLGLGSVYFGGLWFTLRRLRYWRQPVLGAGVSWLVRLSILLGGGAWLLKQTLVPPLWGILSLSAGVWLSRMVLIIQLLMAVDQAAAIMHPVPSAQMPS